jgi:hypothetical protein
MKSASGLQPAQVAERAKFNGRVTYILKKSADETLDNILIPDDLGPLTGSATDAVEGEEPQTGDGPRNIGIQAEDEDRPKKIDTEEADTPPVPPVEPPKKPPEPIVRRRGDMIREELRSRIERLMIESQAETLSGNALLRHQTL